MPTITYRAPDGRAQCIEVRENETVLEALERHAIKVASGCRGGACQSCMLRATAGNIPAIAQSGLKDALKQQGHFLACVARPTTDVTLQPSQGATQRITTTVRSIRSLSPTVARVALKFTDPFDFHPGQFVNVTRSDGLTRSYSLANTAEDTSTGHLVLHVRKVADGQMSNWLHQQEVVGQTVEISGPLGDCFYIPGQQEQQMLLAGTGTGLAPLYAIACDALHQGHTGPIRLYHGARDRESFYLTAELEAIAQQHRNFHYTRCVLTGDESAGTRVGSIGLTMLADNPKPAGSRAFLCGNPKVVTQLRKRLFLAGMKMKDIGADAFLVRSPSIQQNAQRA